MSGRRNHSTLSNYSSLIGAGVASLVYVGLKRYSDDLPRDFGMLWRVIKIRRRAAQLAALKSYTFAHHFAECVARADADTCLIDFVRGGAEANVRVSYREADALSNKVAHWALRAGFKQGDVVALVEDNSAHFLLLWIGLLKVGVVVALVNHNLRGKPLAHSINVASACAVLAGESHARAVADVSSELRSVKRYFVVSHHTLVGSANGQFAPPAADAVPAGAEVLSVVRESDAALSDAQRDSRHVTAECTYIYTSGTTGLPKATRLTHARVLTAGSAFADMYGITARDRLYSPLPLYHSAGLFVGFGGMLSVGGTLVTRKKFSASSFWQDCAHNNVTVIQYIGELCRYLLASPPTPYDTAHKVRLAFGNGLRPDVWPEFQSRFKLPQIGEFYAATEGNVPLFNTRNRVGAIGFVSPLFAPMYPAKIVRFNNETEELVRDANGRCIECKPGEPGEALGGPIKDGDHSSEFMQYTDQKATDKKTARDVFVKGDRYFRTGDLLKRDAEGFYYFVDRIGDTFRWKGENVATTEVAHVLSAVPGVREANVYGVAVPNHDGRAGMASLVIDEKVFELDSVYAACKKDLPAYAAPLFVRLQTEIEITSTFKHKKVDLVKEGYDPAKMPPKEQLFFRDDALKKFVPLDAQLFEEIQQAKGARARL